MIINNIEIENFRCYYGKNELQPNQNGKITLIWGDSGFGKTSLLQFFRWMFYRDPDFGENDDKPIFNISAYEELKPGQMLKMSGKIDFEHLGVKYSLNQEVFFNYAININNASISRIDYSLLHLVNNSWEKYNGDVSNKINTILPKGLSKYFLLNGERARDIVLDSNELKIAIHQLFGLDTYENAVKHLGNKNKLNSVLGSYQRDMTSRMTTISNTNNMSVAQMQEDIQELYEIIESMKDERKKVISEIEQKNARRDEIFKILGEENSKENIQQLLKLNRESIVNYKEKINEIRHQIGELFYNNYPYLFLSALTSKSSSILREKNDLFASAYKNVFNDLRKPLLKEILEKNVCVCGRTLDKESKNRIENIIGVMPPDSYTYQFGQFISKSKTKIQLSQIQIMDYEKMMSDIAICENKITEIESVINEKEEELKRLDGAKKLVNELEQIKADLQALNTKKAGFEGTIARKKLIYESSKKELEKLIKNSEVSSEMTGKIQFFEDIKTALEEEKNQKEKTVKETLNNCVRDIFKKLTTQTELDADKIQFINNDFSLRTTYLTGGQLAVDEYSYVIGIIKALQECKMENNENPIIIDAPFAFTGNTQSEHIFKTFPSVSKQTILLTLDLNKIRFLLDNTDSYDFYVIKNETQTKAIIARGDINDINKIFEKKKEDK